MSLLFLANLFGSVLAFTGIICLANKVRVGFLIFLVVEVCFGYIGYASGNYGLLLSAVIFWFANLHGYIKWGKE